MQLLSRTKKGLRRVAFVALLFSAITFAVPINPEVDSESNESTHSLSTSQEPAEVESDHVDPSKIDEVKDAVQTMLNTKTFFKRLREALPDKKYRKLFEAPSIEVSEFREDTDTNPTYQLDKDKDYEVRDEDFQFKVVLLFSVSNGKLERFYIYGLIRAASLTSASASAEGKSVNGMIWVYRVSIEPHSGVRTKSRDVWVRFQDGVEQARSSFSQYALRLRGLECIDCFNPDVPCHDQANIKRIERIGNVLIFRTLDKGLEVGQMCILIDIIDTGNRLKSSHRPGSVVISKLLLIFYSTWCPSYFTATTNRFLNDNNATLFSQQKRPSPSHVLGPSLFRDHSRHTYLRLSKQGSSTDLPPDELSWSLRVRPAPQCDLRPCFNAELYSNHFDQQPDLDRLAQEAVRQMLNSETFRSRLRSAEKEEIEKLLGGNNRDFGIEVSKFAKDPNPKPLSRPENDQATDQPKEEDYL
ncbi:hypothetical protein F5880DRAFT_1512477, partial [Lentinula raphanica]